MKPTYMLDTTVFNHIVRDDVDLSSLPENATFLVTHIQLNEIQATRNEEKRQRLLRVFAEVPSKQVPTESAVWGVSEWGEAKWGKEDGLFEAMLASLNNRNGSKENNGKDVLIAETAIRNGYVLATDDSDLANVVREFNGKTIHFHELLSTGNAC